MRPSTRLTTLLAAAVLAAAVPVAGCGGGDDSSGGGGGGGGAGGAETEQGAGRAPADVVAAGDPQAGQEVFAQNCASCHGDQGQGGSGPDLQQRSYTDASIVVPQIQNGGGGMPAFGDQLSDQELADVSAFVTEELATR